VPSAARRSPHEGANHCQKECTARWFTHIWPTESTPKRRWPGCAESVRTDRENGRHLPWFNHVLVGTRPRAVGTERCGVCERR